MSLDNDMQEYLQLRNATDPIEAFNLFIKRNCPDLYSHFIDSDDNEAEFVRRVIQSTLRQERERLLEEQIQAFKRLLGQAYDTEWGDKSVDAGFINRIAEQALSDCKEVIQSDE